METILAKVPAPVTNTAVTTNTKPSNGYDHDSKRIPEDDSYPQPVPAPRRNNSIPSDTSQQGAQPQGFHNDIASQVFSLQLFFKSKGNKYQRILSFRRLSYLD